jgi:hypothetical protein
MSEEQALTITVTGKVDLSDVELDREVPLRIAAVRDGEILAEQELKAAKSAGYDLRVPLPFPCGFRLLVGRADAPDAIFVAAELGSVPVSLRHAKEDDRKKAAAGKDLRLQIETLVVDAARYRLWLGWCRRYRVHGRLVCRNRHWDGRHFRFCDDPVPGAKVEIYDVDRFWWFWRRDLVTTVTTAVDGSFEADFWWCCAPWRPWLADPWAIDPAVLERIRRLIEELRPKFRIPLPDPPPDPAALGPFVEALGTALRLGADGGQAPRALSASFPAPEAPLGLEETEIARLLPADDLAALRIWPWWPARDCRPDIVFRATQECHGRLEVVYSESNAQTRWDIPTDVGVTLVANDRACCIPVCQDDPCGDCVKFAQVGCTPVEHIGGNDPLAPVTGDLLGFAYPGSSDYAFAGVLGIDAVFGDLADVDYYELEYAAAGGGPLAFTPLAATMLGGFTRTYWGPPCGTVLPAQFNHPSFAPQTRADAAAIDHQVFETRRHFEDGCDPGTWGISRLWTGGRDRLVDWITAAATVPNGPSGPLLPDGLYALRVVGWRLDGAGHLVDRQVMTRCDTVNEEHLLIRLDNRTLPDHPPSVPDHPWGTGFIHIGTIDPDCDIVSIVKNEGGASHVVNPCDIIELSDSDTLTVHFFVTVPAPDADRHLGAYWMTASYGESATFDLIAAASGGVPQADPTPHVGPTYAQALAQGETRPWWGGGSYKLVLPGSAFPRTCAYLFHLHAHKRVTAGCQDAAWFHYNDTEVSITIKKV